MQKKAYKYIIGIDTGVKTGYASYTPETKQLLTVETMAIHRAMDWVKELARACAGAGWEIFVRVEDPRQAVFGRRLEMHKLKGAGSVMRDAKIWDDFLKDLGVDYEMIRPRKNFTKLDPTAFQKITGFTGVTSQHGRDAAMLIYGY